MVCHIKCVWFNIFSLFGSIYDLINRYGLFGREEYVKSIDGQEKVLPWYCNSDPSQAISISSLIGLPSATDVNLQISPRAENANSFMILKRGHVQSKSTLSWSQSFSKASIQVCCDLAYYCCMLQQTLSEQLCNIMTKTYLSWLIRL